MEANNTAVLLIGNLNDTTKDIEWCIRSYFDVQLSEPVIDDVKKMVAYMKPNLVVLSLVGDKGELDGIFNFLYTSKDVGSVVTIGSIPEYAEYGTYFTTGKFNILYRPLKRIEILQACFKNLGIREGTVEPINKKRPGSLLLTGTERENLVLVVDDSKILLRSMKQWLGNKYRIDLADSADMAMAKIQKQTPDLILLDYEMPGCNGKEFFERLQEDEDYRDIPVIFLTGIDKKNQVVPVLKLLPVRYLLKPVDHNELIDTMEEVFREKEIL